MEWKPLPIGVESFEELIEKGYYFFKDRHAEANSGSGADLLSRASMNFTLAIFDAAANRLYYYELDT